MKVDISRVRRYCHIVFEDYYPLDPFDADELRRNTHNYMAACIAKKTVKNIDEARGLVKSAFRCVEKKWFGNKEYRNLEKITAYFKRLLDQIDDDIDKGMLPEDIIDKLGEEELKSSPPTPRMKIISQCKKCGKRGTLLSSNFGWFVTCLEIECAEQTEYFDTPNEAVDAWNEKQRK